MTVPRAAGPRRRVGFPPPDRLLGVVSGMVVWAVYFVAVYSLVGIGCEAGWNAHAVAFTNLLSVVLVGCTAVALVLIGLCAWRGQQGRMAASARDEDPQTLQRLRFFGLAMLVLSLMAALGTVMVAIPVLMLPPCAA